MKLIAPHPFVSLTACLKKALLLHMMLFMNTLRGSCRSLSLSIAVRSATGRLTHDHSNVNGTQCSCRNNFVADDKMFSMHAK